MVEGLREAHEAREADAIMANPVLPSEILQGLQKQKYLSISFLGVPSTLYCQIS